MNNPCVDCISLAICCHLKTTDMLLKCDPFRAFVTEGQQMVLDTSGGIEHIDTFKTPRFIIKLNQDNVDIVHSYYRKVKALGI